MNINHYTKAVGRKFHEDGTVRYFPGNTIICPIETENAAYAKLIQFAEQFRKLACARKYTLLPPSSYHMTVIQGVCEEDRRKELWSRYLPLDMPLEETDQFFKQKFAAVGMTGGFQMKFNYVSTRGVALTVNLLPASDEDSKALKTFRDDVSERLGLRFPDHDQYEFHISIAYKIYELTGEEEEELRQFKLQAERSLQEMFGVLTTPPPQLVFFKDMFKFASTRQ